MDPSLTAVITRGAHAGVKKILINDAYVHPQSNLDASNCGAGTSLRDRHIWVVNTMKMLDHLPETRRWSHRTSTSRTTHRTLKWGKYHKIPRSTKAHVPETTQTLGSQEPGTVGRRKPLVPTYLLTYIDVTSFLPARGLEPRTLGALV